MTSSRTGRTTRMLEEAIRAARNGEYVIVAAASSEHARALQQQAALLAQVEPYATKIRVGDGEITFESVQDARWDWHTFLFRGAYPGIPTFVDHYAIEQRMDAIRQQITRLQSERDHISPEAHKWDK